MKFVTVPITKSMDSLFLNKNIQSQFSHISPRQYKFETVKAIQEKSGEYRRDRRLSKVGSPNPQNAFSLLCKLFPCIKKKFLHDNLIVDNMAYVR